jgi:hypothetical protein
MAAKDPIGQTSKTRLAVAITVTEDGTGTGGFIDGASVLAWSVHRYRKMSPEFEVDMVAIVTPGVRKARAALRAAGYRIVEEGVPVTSNEISTSRWSHLKKTIDKSGCCGPTELTKLAAYKLEEYKWILLCDADSLMLTDFTQWPILADAGADSVEAQYTYDHGLGGGCINGGFILVWSGLVWSVRHKC